MGARILHENHYYVNRAWIDPLDPSLLDVIDSSTEEVFARVAVGDPKDVDRASKPLDDATTLPRLSDVKCVPHCSLRATFNLH